MSSLFELHYLSELRELRVTRTTHTGYALRMSVRAYEPRELIEIIEIIMRKSCHMGPARVTRASIQLCEAQELFEPFKRAGSGFLFVRRVDSKAQRARSRFALATCAAHVVRVARD